MTGCVRRNVVETVQSEPAIEIEPALLSRCNRAYRACMMTLVDWCPSLPKRELTLEADTQESLVA
jgi:hypothetical protein